MDKNKHLISLDEFLQLARPASKHIDKDEVEAYIREAEDLHIVPLIGVELFGVLVSASLSSELDDNQKTLLRGGVYDDGCGCAKKPCAGLKRAVAYLAYARMVAANGGIVTRTGYMAHDDTYSSRVDDKNRANARRDVQNMADYYLGQCVEFYNVTYGASCCGGNGHRGTLVRIKSIGYTPNR